MKEFIQMTLPAQEDFAKIISNCSLNILYYLKVSVHKNKAQVLQNTFVRVPIFVKNLTLGNQVKFRYFTH